MLLDRITCRPISQSASQFASGSANYYGMLYVASICETELKVRGSGGFTVLAIVLVLIGLGLVGLNKACLDKVNRLHAIARGDIYSEVMRARPLGGGRGCVGCVRACASALTRRRRRGRARAGG